MNSLNKILLLASIVLGVILSTAVIYINKLKEERDTYQSNTYALLSDIKRLQIDSTTSALDVKVLKLTLDEYKKYRAEDLEKIKQLKIRFKDIQTIAKHNLEVNAPIDAIVRDSVIIRDSLRVQIQTVTMRSPYLEIDGIIEKNRLKGHIQIPVNLNQTIWIEYKHRFLWWRWGKKTVHQTIMTDNPHVKINYSEVIELRN